MLSKKIAEVGNPIIYIFLSLAISCISYGIFEEFRGLTIFIVAFFFISILYYCGIEFTGFMIAFFILGFFLNYSYYKVQINVTGEVRIIQKSQYNIVGNYGGKNITIETNNKDCNIGEIYNITGKLEKVQDKINGIVGIVKPERMDKINGDFITKLYDFKRKIYVRLEDNLGKRKAGLISSIAFGYSDNLDFEDKDDMKTLGIIHSISVSGLHVVIVYGFLRIFMGCKFGLLGTMLYVIFTGSNYSCLRAFVMLACVEGGKILKRNNSSISALCFSATILILYQPFSIFNISLHLSYLATWGIVMFNKKINDLLYKLHNKLRESLSLTLSAQVFSLPYLILIFKDFSANFIVGNLILVPLVDLMVITGNILPLVYIFPKLFDFCSYLNLIIIEIFDWLVDIINIISLPTVYGNENIVFVYLASLMGFYFVKKGYRKFIYLPFICIFTALIQIYSPIPNIKYYKEGAILVSYKWERLLMVNKSQVDMKRLLKITFATKAYRKEGKIVISGIGNIKTQGKNYVLETFNKKYLLKMSNGEKELKEYDIINFKDGVINEIFIINGNVI